MEAVAGRSNQALELRGEQYQERSFITTTRFVETTEMVNGKDVGSQKRKDQKLVRLDDKQSIDVVFEDGSKLMVGFSRRPASL